MRQSDDHRWIHPLQQYLVLSLSAFTGSLYLTVEYVWLRTIVHDPTHGCYTFSRGGKIIVHQPSHNIFLMLKSRRVGRNSKETRIKLSLNKLA